ncbi:unnamed protein product, partial [Amoebophrya sp. A25]
SRTAELVNCSRCGHDTAKHRCAFQKWESRTVTESVLNKEMRKEYNRAATDIDKIEVLMRGRELVDEKLAEKRSKIAGELLEAIHEFQKLTILGN